MKNLIEHLKPDHIAPFTWDHPPLGCEPLEEGGIRVIVPARADYFRNPDGTLAKDDAPFLWLSVTGDFVAQAHVRPHFASTYDSGVLMARHDPHYWAKLCFEKTDFGTTAAVSVVTRVVSDDANGADISTASLWLQMVRVGNLFGLHYATDGNNWRMVRYFHLEVPASLKVGIVAQCPAGPGSTIDFLHFSLEQRTIANLRSGV
jgi:uncharacterized protein